MKKKLSLFLIMIIAISAVLAGCGGDEKKDTGKSSSTKQVLNLVEASEIPSLDPSKATDAVSFLVLTNIMEGLYRLDDKDKAVDGMADGDPVISEDGTKWEITLRDAKWSNGDKVTAEDFVYSWQRLVNPETNSEYAYMMEPVKNAMAISNGEMAVTELGIKAVSDKKLEITLEKATPYFKELMAFPSFFPQNKKFVEAKGDKYGTEYDAVLFNGPFVLTDWKHEDGWNYAKNKDYWEAKVVKLDEINVKVVKDVNTAVNLYETGKIDRVIISAEHVTKYKGSEDFKTYEDPGMYFFRFNQAKAPILANVDGRKAIAMALDKQGFCDVLLNNGSMPADYFVPANFVSDENGNDFRKVNGNMNSYNVAKAKEHWEAAKKALGVDTVSLTLLNYDQESSKKAGEYAKEQLESNLPGLTVELKSLPFKQKLADESSGDYEFSFAGWSPDYPDPMTFLDMFVTDGGHNQMSYSNKKYDELIEAAGGELLNDPAKRWDAFQQAEKILIEEDQAIGPIYQRGLAVLQDPKIKNLISHQFSGDYSYKWCSIEK